MKLAGWGRYPKADCVVTAPRDLKALARAVTQTKTIARGNGRAYGDSALQPVNTISTRHLNRMVSFDPETGVLVAEAGVSVG